MNYRTVLDVALLTWIAVAGRKLNPSLACSGNCSYDEQAFTPVCGSDGRNYFSPCYAGCQVDTKNTTGKVDGCFVYKKFTVVCFHTI